MTTYDASSKVQVTTLPNGLRVASATMPFSTIMLAVYVKVGANYETEVENGISHFLEHMAFKGTSTRSPKDIVYEIERVGGELNAATGRETTFYVVYCLPEHIHTAIDILADGLQNSTFPADKIAREQDAVVQEILEHLDDTYYVGLLATQATSYPNQYRGRPILGTEANVRSFNAEDLRNYMSRHYTPDNMLVVAVGAVDHDELVTLTTEHFSSLKGSTLVAQNSELEFVGGESVIINNSCEQAHIFVSFPAPGSLTAEFAAYDLLTVFLGGGMSSPLFHEIREKRGLCYSVSAIASPGVEQSIFTIHGSTVAANVDEFLHVACTELSKIAKGHVDHRDFERAKNIAFYETANRQEHLTSWSSIIASALLFAGKLRTAEELRQYYADVTVEQLVSAAKTMISGKRTVVVAGKAEDKSYSPIVAAAFE